MGITMKDIAEMAGVSSATVSRMLNQNGIVNEETRRRILDAMSRHNYVHEKKRRRNGVTSSSASPSAVAGRNFAIIWSGGSKSTAYTTAQSIMCGLTQAAGRAGATVNLTYLSDAGDDHKIVEQRNIDGFFLSGAFRSAAFCEKMRQFPVVWLLQSGTHDFGDRVQPDHYRTGVMAFRYLSGKGCRNLCCISTQGLDEPYRFWKTREDGFVNAAEVANMPCRILRCRGENPTSEQIRQLCDDLKALPTMPDGFFVTSEIGVRFYQRLQMQGLVPFRDFHIVLGDKELCPNCEPEAPKIDIGAEELGRVAFETMIQRIENPGERAKTVMIEPQLWLPEAVPVSE